MWSSGSGISVVKIWKRCVQPGRSSTFVYWDWRALQTMSLPSLPAQQSDRSRCWAPCTPVRPSKRLWQTAFADRTPFEYLKKASTGAPALHFTVSDRSLGLGGSENRKIFQMNDALPSGMREASRLARAGRLAEATALLQRVLH